MLSEKSVKDLLISIQPYCIFNYIILYKVISSIFKSYPIELITLINKWYILIYINLNFDLCGNSLCHAFLFKNSGSFPCLKCKKVYLCAICATKDIYTCSCGNIIDYV